tara:strand:- start:171 stop:806 length:636 start_codon:yes stop_codon:yes gene_type:complete
MIPITLWIVEDDTTYRRTLQRMLSREKNITCERVFPSCVELLDAMAVDKHPDLVLMDLGLPEMGGVEGIRRLARLAPNVTVLVLTVFQDKENVLRALDAGAAGYLLKTAQSRDIVKGINDIFMGQAALSPSVAKIVLEEMRQPMPIENFNLSDREIEVLEQLATGLNVQEIADALDITVRTVNFHLGNTYKKLEVQSQSAAVAKALRSRII